MNEQRRKDTSHRLIIGISGASGAILGIRLLQVTQKLDLETHLVISQAGKNTILQETHWQIDQVLALADNTYPDDALGAAIASGSFRTRGMVIIPCSIKTLTAVANAYTNTLISRAADVTLKEGRPLVLVVREAPLHAGHLRLMGLAADTGAVIYPPVPSFYMHPQTIDDLVDNMVGRILSRLGIDNDLYQEWGGVDQ